MELYLSFTDGMSDTTVEVDHHVRCLCVAPHFKSQTPQLYSLFYFRFSVRLAQMLEYLMQHTISDFLSLDEAERAAALAHMEGAIRVMHGSLLVSHNFHACAILFLQYIISTLSLYLYQPIMVRACRHISTPLATKLVASSLWGLGGRCWFLAIPFGSFAERYGGMRMKSRKCI